MKLWLISQDARDGYDTYDSAVVAAETQEEARAIHPRAGQIYPSRDWAYTYGTWAMNPDQVSVVLIGEASEDALKLNKVICASFNAG